MVSAVEILIEMRLVGNDFGNNPYFNGTDYGLPELTADEHSNCGDLPSSRPCIWDGMYSIIKPYQY